MLEFSIAQVAEILGGHVEGNPEAKVSQLCKIEEGHPGGLSFLANLKYTPYIYDTQATAVIVSSDFVATAPLTTTLIRVSDPYESFTMLLATYDRLRLSKTGIDPKAIIGCESEYGTDCYIGPYVVIGDHVRIGNRVKIFANTVIGDHVSIGDDTVIQANVSIYDQSVIGRECQIHSGVVIGADGFGFAPHDASYTKVPQIGNVIIEDYVEIGANTCIDRATLGSTVIQKGVKLDNLIQIAHNVVIGSNTVMASQVGISGSTKIGKNCMFGGQVGVAGHALIADGVKLAAQSGVPSSIKTENAIFFGSPALEASDYRRSSIHFKNFDKLVKRIDDLERRLKQLDACKPN